MADVAVEPEGPGVRGVAFGYLAVLPLFAAYELGVAGAESGSPRNLAELIVGRVLVFASSYETVVRVTFLAAAGLAAFVQTRLAGIRIARSGLRVILEGVVFALALGPLLVAAMALFGLGVAELGLDTYAPGSGVTLDRAARALGAGAWEELVFRVGVFSAIFLLARRLFTFLGVMERLGRGLAEAVAVLLSALFFAAGHLDVLTRFLGLDGESYEPRVFLWRTVAGCLLAGLFRWRGLGVAAWAHGLFNLALILGSGPGVFR